MVFSLEEIDHATEYVLGQLGYASLKEKQKEALTAFVRGLCAALAPAVHIGNAQLLITKSYV